MGKVYRCQSVPDKSIYKKSAGKTVSESIFQSVAPCSSENVPRQRGRPRKTPLKDDGGENIGAVIAKALHLVKTQGKPIITSNNGFSRQLKADTILGAFLQDNVLIFAVRFKGRKLPEFIQAAEMKIRAPDHMVEFYMANINC